jgi:hypothetical protein
MSWLPEEDDVEKEVPRHKQQSEEQIAIIANADPNLNLPTKSLSWSQINLYLTCGHRYYHKYVLKKPQPNSSNLVHGRMLHSVLESMHIYKMENGVVPPRERHQDEISDAVRDLEAEVDSWDVKVPDASVAEDSARLLTDIYYDERLPHVRPRAVELKVVSLIRGRVPFLGYIDLVEKNPMEPDGYVNPMVDPSTPVMGDTIVDLKMTGKKYAPSQVENGAQLTLYAAVTGVADVGYDLLIQKKNSEFVSQRAIRTIADKEHVLDLVEDIAQGISAGYFPKTTPESWACDPKWCPYYGECRGRKR